VVSPVAVAEQYVKDTIEVMNVGRSNPEFVGVIDQLRECMTRGGEDAFMRGRVLLTELDTALGTEQANFIGVAVQTAEAAKLWRRHRVVYRVHRGLADSLFDTDTRAAVPCEVLARLPHPDPFAVFAGRLTVDELGIGRPSSPTLEEGSSVAP
jgi:hypothetical protein